jgi:hypothetical protein
VVRQIPPDFSLPFSPKPSFPTLAPISSLSHTNALFFFLYFRWDYVEENNVLLPDEYDQIHRDLEHFWALHPEDMRKLELAYEDHRDSYTLGKSGHHPISIVNASLNENAMQGYLQFASEMIDTLQPVQDWIPDFRAVFSPHDTPDLPVSYQHMKLAKKTILHGKCTFSFPSLSFFPPQ